MFEQTRSYFVEVARPAGSLTASRWPCGIRSDNALSHVFGQERERIAGIQSFPEHKRDWILSEPPRDSRGIPTLGRAGRSSLRPTIGRLRETSIGSKAGTSLAPQNSSPLSPTRPITVAAAPVGHSLGAPTSAPGLAPACPRVRASSSLRVALTWRFRVRLQAEGSAATRDAGRRGALRLAARRSASSSKGGRDHMIVLRLILRIIGFIAKVAILWTIGAHPARRRTDPRGAGGNRRAVGGRRHYYYRRVSRPWRRRA